MESTTYSNESGKDIARTCYVWLDYSKVLCIAGVVYGHCVADVLSSYIFLFHVPIFFIISGILYRPKRYIDTLKSLFVPVLLFSLLLYPWHLYGIWNQGRGWSFETMVMEFVMGLDVFFLSDGLGLDGAALGADADDVLRQLADAVLLPRAHERDHVAHVLLSDGLAAVRKR